MFVHELTFTDTFHFQRQKNKNNKQKKDPNQGKKQIGLRDPHYTLYLPKHTKSYNLPASLSLPFSFYKFGTTKKERLGCIFLDSSNSFSANDQPHCIHF